MAREQDDRKHAAEEAAMERHAALPELQALPGVLGEIARIVDQHIADASAEDDAERHPEDEVVVVGDGEWRRPTPERIAADDRARIEPAQKDTDDIGERIPADGDRPEADQHG